jgi:hypothetical protein
MTLQVAMCFQEVAVPASGGAYFSGLYLYLVKHSASLSFTLHYQWYKAAALPSL